MPDPFICATSRNYEFQLYSSVVKPLLYNAAENNRHGFAIVHNTERTRAIVPDE